MNVNYISSRIKLTTFLTKSNGVKSDSEPDSSQTFFSFDQVAFRYHFVDKLIMFRVGHLNSSQRNIIQLLGLHLNQAMEATGKCFTADFILNFIDLNFMNSTENNASLSFTDDSNECEGRGCTAMFITCILTFII